MTQRSLLVVVAWLAAAACAQPAATGAAAPPSPAVQGVLDRAAAAQPPAPPPPAAPAAPAPPAVKDIDPVGTYLVNLVAQGNAISVTAKIERNADGTLGGTVTSDNIPVLPITSVKVSGKTMRVTVTGPNGDPAILNLMLEGDVLTGDWAMGMDGSAVTGRKLPGPT